jgi:hypothetical protein
MCRTHAAYTPYKPSDNAATYPRPKRRFRSPSAAEPQSPLPQHCGRHATIQHTHLILWPHLAIALRPRGFPGIPIRDARSAEWELMSALSLAGSVRVHGFQMHHYRGCAGDPLKN